MEVVGRYGYFTDNTHAIKRLWVTNFEDPARFVSWWIDADADEHDYWELSILQVNGDLFLQTGPDGDKLWFARIQMQTVLVSESKKPVQTVWANRNWLYNTQRKNGT